MRILRQRGAAAQRKLTVPGADEINALSEDHIRARLAERQADPYISPFRESPLPAEPLPAAVLIPLLRQDGAWRVLLIRRTHVEGDFHSGQVAFPGGRVEAADQSVEQAALREAHEETGVDVSQIRVLGRLEDMITISNYQVTPVVGVIPWPFEIRPQEAEVARVFTVPLARLADPANREERQRQIPGEGTSIAVHYFTKFDDELLWGVSARITLTFLEALGLA